MEKGINNGGVLPPPPPPPPPLPSSVRPKPSLLNGKQITDTKGENEIKKGQETFLAEAHTSVDVENHLLKDRKISQSSSDTDSGIEGSISGSESNFNLPVPDMVFDHAKEKLQSVKNLIEPSQYGYAENAINRLEIMNDNLQYLEKALTNDNLSLLEKERAFMDCSGSTLVHIDDGSTHPMTALSEAKGMLISFQELLEDEGVNKQEFFEGFFQKDSACFEARSRVALSYKLKVDVQYWNNLSEKEQEAKGPVLNMDIVAEYGHDLDIDTIINNEVLAYQKINNLDPMIDMVSGAEFKAYLMAKAEDFLGYQAKDGVITEQAIDAFINQQVDEFFTMDP